MQPIKVLEVIRQGEIGGGESHLLDLIAHFRPQEIEVVVLAFTPGAMIDSLQERGIKAYVIKTSRPFDIRVYRQIQSIILSENIQLIHAHGSRAASNLILIARKLHLPFIYTVHGWSFHQDQNKIIYKLRCLSEKIICRYSHKVICVSQSNLDTGQNNFGLKNAVVIENGINLQRFNPENTFKDIRTEFNFTSQDFIVGFIARLTLQKAPLDFVKSILIAHQQIPNLKALIVGDGDMREEISEYITNEQANDFIRTSPFRQDVPDLLHAINIFCIPSLWEGLSISLLEAMAMKKALVVTPTDGTYELIKHNINGKIAHFSNPQKLAEYFIEYYNHPEQIEKFSSINQKIIQQRFDCSRVSEQVTKIYKEFL